MNNSRSQINMSFTTMSFFFKQDFLGSLSQLSLIFWNMVLNVLFMLYCGLLNIYITLQFIIKPIITEKKIGSTDKYKARQFVYKNEELIALKNENNYLHGWSPFNHYKQFMYSNPQVYRTDFEIQHKKCKILTFKIYIVTHA